MGTLFVVATPIGNLEDISVRAIKTLLTVDIIACEDTRRTGMLLSEIKKRYSSLCQPSDHLANESTFSRLDDHTEFQKAPELIQKLQEGKNVALVSDAGTPLLSDPGYILVSQSIKRGIKVVSIPGPSAALAALTASGLPSDKFLFLGYPPEKQSHRIKLFHQLVETFTKPSLANQSKGSLKKDLTIIFYCAPHKLTQTLEDVKEVFGNRTIVIARELTKMHEEVVTLSVAEALTTFASPKGEFTILFTLSE